MPNPSELERQENPAQFICGRERRHGEDRCPNCLSSEIYRIGVKGTAECPLPKKPPVQHDLYPAFPLPD